MRRLIRHPLRLAGFALSLLILLTLFHLLTLGVPGTITRKITGHIQAQGIPVQIESIRLSPRGWVLRNVRLYSLSPDDLKPLLKTEALTLSVWPDNWFKPSKTGWDISMCGKKTALSLGPVWETTLSADNPFRTIARFEASLHIDRQQLRLKESSVLWGLFHIQADGDVNFSDQPSGYSLPEFQNQATRIARILGGLPLEAEPEINIHFYVDADAPEKTFVEAGLLAENLLWKTQVYNLHAGLSYTNGRAILNPLRIARADGSRLTATGSLDIETRIAKLEIDNSLPAEALLNLLPEQIQTDLARAEIAPFGATEFSVRLGPAPVEQILEQIHVDVTRLSAIRKDLTLDPLAFELIRDGDHLTVEKIKAHANEGTLTGHFEMDIPSGKWETALYSSGAHPDPVGTLVGPGLQMWIDRAAFSNQPPDVHVNLSYGGTKGSLRMDGTFSAQNISCTGGPLDTLQVGMAYSNRALTLAPLHAAYGNRQFNGTVQVDFAQKIARFSITTNGFSPKTIARVLAPDHPSFLEKLTFSGPIQSSGTGQIDYGTWLRHIVHATLRADQVSLGSLQVRAFNSRIDCLGTQLTFTNTSIDFCDGLADGSAEFDILLRDGSAPYHIKARAESIDFQKLSEQISTDDHSRTAGVLSGNIDVTADAKIGFWESAQGSGSVTIANGQLANLPLLGGFTHLIQSAIPGFNLFSITTLFADYELRDEKLTSENVQFGGTLLSAHAKGSYSPATGLNVRLRVVPLRETRENKKWYQLHLWSAEALKKTTAPLFGLLEIKLEGSLKDPEWHMVSVPKEIYSIIRRDKPEDSELP